jgi:hydrogenase expression/formation protein HypD
MEASRQSIRNFYLLSMHKLMPPAMAALIDQGINIDGYIGPGHVTVVAGAGMYNSLVEKYRISVVIAGFEPVDMLQAILMLVEMKEQGRYGTEIQYRRAVTQQGNRRAIELVNSVFEPADDSWRGLGLIQESGLKIRSSFSSFDAMVGFEMNMTPSREPAGCLCGEILRGLKKPHQCPMFARVCTPVNPVGACMVSSEGACHAYYAFS